MKTIRRICTVTLLMALTGVSATFGDGVDLKDFLSGKHAPLSLRLKDLDDTWCRFGLGAQSDSGALLMLYARLMGGASGAAAYYTKGETVMIAGETYVLAYRQQAKSVDATALLRSGTPPSPEKLTPDTVLALALIQLRTAGSLTDIRRFNLEQEISDQESVRTVIEDSREKALNANSLNNLRQIGLGLAMYADENKQKLPPMSDPQDLRKALGKYISSEKVYVHPRTGEEYVPNASLSGKDWQGPDADKAVVVYEAKTAEDGTRGV